MIDWSKYDLSQAHTTYGVANSPMFLLDSLRGDFQVGRLARDASALEIEQALRELLQRDDKNLAERTKPFVLIAAAAVKNDPGLARAIKEIAGPYGGWVALLATAVAERPLSPVFRNVHFEPKLNNGNTLRSDTQTTLSSFPR